MLAYHIFSTDWGWMAVAGSEKGIRWIVLPEQTRQGAMDALARTLKGQHAGKHPELFDRFSEQVCRYLRGEVASWDVRLDMDMEGTPTFSQKAWAVCRTIPSGETRSYGWLAAQAGRPGAARAAGQAMARNPVPLVVPCHRVIAGDGGLGGFGGGTEMKVRLLELEKTFRIGANLT